ncbi:hypothetical protein HG535_0C01700 [Zygotorulaspora mrakii]|uniref:Pre-mRNA-splicing factor CWC2 n=1 Tax=Zygotorulaspora mrakii TaxID=42260 RepID=A0A7H9AZN4_ZYGMR|nr:uncharacterized protein HG535_0C01700 [Zygotorulaspora mrakii]QLG71821.1 hypothetical protein HG535_0C01700 [Zygotorulaspora mrakii]
MSKSKSWRDRSARVQVDERELPSSMPAQTGLVFNVWYNKWSQGQGGQRRFVNPFRLDTKVHPGVTRGDKENTNFFCLYFAKGMCCLGKKCQYKHHIPEEQDIMQLSMKTDVLDCFGREKFADYRDDMGGVGSFRKNNRTLYIGGLSGALNNKQLKPSQIEGRLRYIFSKLGEIDRVRYIESKNCAFVKYRHQCNTEFAKEAMSNQTLLIPSDKEWADRKEGAGLLVKWGNDDPDPEARKREEEEQKEESLNMMVKLLNNFGKRQSEQLTVEEKHESIKKLSQDKATLFDEKTLQKLKKRKANPETVASLKISKLLELNGTSNGLVDYPSSSEEE